MQVIADIVSMWTGIPVNKIVEEEAEKLLNMESILHNRVVGQEEAIKSTSKKVAREELENVELILDGHQNMDKYVQEEVSCIVFNLGYLPRAKHQIITKADTTLEAIKKGLELLKPNGVMSIAIYSGHEGGMEEKNAVYEFTQTLDQNYFNVLCTKFINQINNPPELLLIEKKG